MRVVLVFFAATVLLLVGALLGLSMSPEAVPPVTVTDRSAVTVTSTETETVAIVHGNSDPHRLVFDSVLR